MARELKARRLAIEQAREQREAATRLADQERRLFELSVRPWSLCVTRRACCMHVNSRRPSLGSARRTSAQCCCRRCLTRSTSTPLFDTDETLSFRREA